MVDSRSVRGGRAIRRRRECVQCQARFTTYEECEPLRIIVVKRGGARREIFSRDKVRGGVAKALEKRPKERDVDAIVDAVEADVLRSAKNSIITSRAIGRIVLAQLRACDEVAYLRFASVYKAFGSVQAFEKELAAMDKETTA